MKKRLLTTALALGAAGMLALSGCTPSTSNDAADDSKGTINIGLFNWDEAIAVSNLWKYVLEEEGYEVTLTDGDPGAVYVGLSEGDFDLVLDTWLPLTHKEYLKTYGDSMVDLGVWNDEAVLTIAVNEDAPIDSLEELADNADLFKNQLIGIEPGAGLTAITTDAVIPGYGLEKMDYVTSSTPAMLAELKTATDGGENIAVTLWRPHWAYDAFPLKDLKDPKGLLGEAEEIHSFGSLTFEEDFPEVADRIKAFKLSSDALHSLENVMFNENDDASKYPEIIAKWLKDNPEIADQMTA